MSLKIRCSVSIWGLLTSDPTPAAPHWGNAEKKKIKPLKLVTVLLMFSPLWTYLRAFEGQRMHRAEEGAGDRSVKKPEGLQTSLAFILAHQEHGVEKQGHSSCPHQPSPPTWQVNNKKPPNDCALFSCIFHIRISATHRFAV